jgi:hypothetical protein
MYTVTMIVAVCLLPTRLPRVRAKTLRPEAADSDGLLSPWRTGQGANAHRSVGC